jgi:hypothetical protein
VVQVQALHERGAVRLRLPQGTRVGAVAQRLGHERRARIGLGQRPEVGEALVDGAAAIVVEGLGEQRAVPLPRCSVERRIRQLDVLRVLQRRPIAGLVPDRAHLVRLGAPPRRGLRHVEQAGELRQARVVRPAPQDHPERGQVHGLGAAVQSGIASLAIDPREPGLSQRAVGRSVAQHQLIAQRQKLRVAAARGVAPDLGDLQRFDPAAAHHAVRQVVLQHLGHAIGVEAGLDAIERVHAASRDEASARRAASTTSAGAIA